MRPSEKLSKLVRTMRICATFCGVDVIDREYKVNTITYFVIILVLSYYVCLVYTIVLKISTNFTYILETVCMTGFAFQGISKLVSILRYQNTYRSQYEMLANIYEQYEAKSKKYSLVLSRCISRIQVTYQMSAFIYTAVGLLQVSIPLYTWILRRRRVLTLQFLVPLLDEDTSFGYFATVGVHSACLAFSLAGSFTLDMFVLMFFAHCALFVDIFRVKAEELNDLATEFGSEGTRVQLKDIIEWHQTYSNFVENSDMIFFWVNFTQVTTSGISTTLTLLISIIGDWPGCYVFILFSMSTLYLYCGMGTWVEIANDKFTEEIYAIHWYLLTISQQKSIQFMLMKSQVQNNITVGGVAPLSVNTGLQVTKTVYSVFMMMLNFYN